MLRDRCGDCVENRAFALLCSEQLVRSSLHLQGPAGPLQCGGQVHAGTILVTRRVRNLHTVQIIISVADLKKAGANWGTMARAFALISPDALHRLKRCVARLVTAGVTGSNPVSQCTHVTWSAPAGAWPRNHWEQTRNPTHWDGVDRGDSVYECIVQSIRLLALVLRTSDLLWVQRKLRTFLALDFQLHPIRIIHRAHTADLVVSPGIYQVASRRTQ
jgi:hypothetical protein